MEPRIGSNTIRLGDPSQETGLGDIELGGYSLHPFLISLFIYQTYRRRISLEGRVSECVHLFTTQNQFMPNII